jgi:hypothetical protein
MFGPDFAMMVSVVGGRTGGMVLKDGAYHLIRHAPIESTWDENDYQTGMTCHVETDDATYDVTGEVISLIPLRNRRADPDGNQLVTLTGSAVVPTLSSVNYNTSPVTITNARYHLGRPYTATYNSLPIDLAAQDGSTAGRLRRLNRIRINTYRSREGTVWNASPARAQLIHRNPDVTTPLLDGWQEIVLDPGNLTETTINITHASPYPLTLRAASLSWNIQEP